MDNSKIEKLVETLNKKNFKASFFTNAQDAKMAVLNEIAPGSSVGIGGSMTIVGLGIPQELLDSGHEVFCHSLADPSEITEVRKKAANADVYLSSTNALTLKGELVNIDGVGNRISSLIYGPKKVIILCGINKITENYHSAIDRIKTVACPANAKRLNLKTPCALTGKCNDCDTPDRMCNATLKIEYPTRGKEIHIIIAGESLGF